MEGRGGGAQERAGGGWRETGGRAPATVAGQPVPEATRHIAGEGGTAGRDVLAADPGARRPAWRRHSDSPLREKEGEPCRPPAPHRGAFIVAAVESSPSRWSRPFRFPRARKMPRRARTQARPV